MTLMDLLGGGAGGAKSPEARSIMFVGEVTEDRAADLSLSTVGVISDKRPRCRKSRAHQVVRLNLRRIS